MTITATYSNTVVGSPLISINQPGTTDIVSVPMSGNGNIRTYIYDVNKANVRIIYKKEREKQLIVNNSEVKFERFPI